MDSYIGSVVPFNETQPSDKSILTGIRVFTMIVMMVALAVHLRKIKIFRWETTVSGGILVTYAIVSVGLVICITLDRCSAKVFQSFICITGAVLLLVNAAALYYRWRQSSQLARVVAEFLVMMGITVRRQVLTKIFLSSLAGLMFLIDLCFTPFVIKELGCSNTTSSKP